MKHFTLLVILSCNIPQLANGQDIESDFIMIRELDEIAVILPISFALENKLIAYA